VTSFLGESDYTPEQVEALETDAAETFIEQMDESYVFLKDEITGFEIALQIIDRSYQRGSRNPRPPDTLAFWRRYSV
jgi:hypothetical protein